MEQLLTQLMAIPQETFFWSMASMIGLCAIGLLPSQNDLHLMALGIVSSIYQTHVLLPIAVGALTLAAGESTMYVLGRFLGAKVFQKPFVQKRIPPEKQQGMTDKISSRPKRLLVATRMSPILKPYLMLSLGALQLPTKLFLSIYLPFSLFYSSATIAVAYYFSDTIRSVFAG